MKKNAYIFGISGQDGSYLANLLLKKILMSSDLQDQKIKII